MPLEKLDKKHFAKGSRGSERNGVGAAPEAGSNLKEIALMEAKIIKLCDSLEEVRICHRNISPSLISVDTKYFASVPFNDFYDWVAYFLLCYADNCTNKGQCCEEAGFDLRGN